MLKVSDYATMNKTNESHDFQYSEVFSDLNSIKVLATAIFFSVKSVDSLERADILLQNGKLAKRRRGEKGH